MCGQLISGLCRTNGCDRYSTPGSGIHILWLSGRIHDQAEKDEERDGTKGKIEECYAGAAVISSIDC